MGIIYECSAESPFNKGHILGKVREDGIVCEYSNTVPPTEGHILGKVRDDGIVCEYSNTWPHTEGRFLGKFENDGLVYECSAEWPFNKGHILGKVREDGIVCEYSNTWPHTEGRFLAKVEGGNNIVDGAAFLLLLNNQTKTIRDRTQATITKQNDNFPIKRNVSAFWQLIKDAFIILAICALAVLVWALAAREGDREPLPLILTIVFYLCAIVISCFRAKKRTIKASSLYGMFTLTYFLLGNILTIISEHTFTFELNILIIGIVSALLSLIPTAIAYVIGKRINKKFS